MTTKQASTTTGNGKTEVKIHAPKKLDIGCGRNKQKGFKGLDFTPDSDADIIWDFNEIPWPIKSNSVEQVFCSHVVEHIPHWRPGWELDGWWRFFDELYRVMKDGATGEFIHPFSRSDRAFWDPTHVRYINDMTWNYLNPEWRQANGLDHYCGSCDFEVVTFTMLGLEDDYLTRNIEHQNYTRSHYWNVIQDLGVLIKARKSEEMAAAEVMVA